MIILIIIGVVIGVVVFAALRSVMLASKDARRGQSQLLAVCQRIANVARQCDPDALDIPKSIKVMRLRFHTIDSLVSIDVGKVFICEIRDSGNYRLVPNDQESLELLPALLEAAESMEAQLLEIKDRKEQRRRDKMAKAIEEAKK